MIRWYSVTARCLRRRTIFRGDVIMRHVTLFPFFDGEGFVEKVLIVGDASAELLAFDPNEATLCIPPWGPIWFSGAIEVLSDRVLRQLATLWHFDPWWLLTDERFEDHDAVPVLKKTNCVDEFSGEPKDLVFSGSLQKLRKVSYPVVTQETTSRPFLPGMLPDLESEDRSDDADRIGWVLDPVW